MDDKVYKISETFYSLKGEGEWTGSAMFFIRLAGCNLNCNFCDTDYKQTREATINELVKEALTHRARKVVITGGEPCLQDTQPLVVALRREGFKCHLETNGTLPTHMDWDWIAISPKSKDVNPETIKKASEFKFLCGMQGWEELMKWFFVRFDFHPKKADAPIVWLMPLAKAWPHRLQDSFLEDNIQQAVQYCLDNPRVKFCLQIHKCIGIK